MLIIRKEKTHMEEYQLNIRINILKEDLNLNLTDLDT